MDTNRRAFFQLLAASAVLTPTVRAWAQQLAVSNQGSAIGSAKDALQIMDFEEAARRALPPAHWGYMASGSDDDMTLKANVEAFRHIGLKPRRLVDVSKPDLSTQIFGAKWETPLFICPVGGQRAFHAEGEMATARAAKARHHSRGRRQDTGHAAMAAALYAGKVGRHREDGEAHRRCR